MLEQFMKSPAALVSPGGPRANQRRRDSGPFRAGESPGTLPANKARRRRNPTSTSNLENNPPSQSHLDVPTPSVASPPKSLANCPSFSRPKLSPAMSHLAAASSSMLRACARQQLPAARAAIAGVQQRRGVADAAPKSSSFDSPFTRSETTKIPSFSKYAAKGSATSNKVFSYFVAGSMGLVSAVGAKATVQGGFPFRPSLIS